ncbi:MerR-like DNA binding protein [Streptomyces sp. 2333.5]|uniref:MerR family transcriptional regulator n=1 Tax=unclassified Streptomyces TaxID=2593676 RepID=UPI0008980831|nr:MULTISPECIES: MerR family transcriptional regulator [unclassified Streptomyces]PJJ03251.1 MerR-like DNA binding protein [Streptomyces sp. 2333.5]SED51458.1 MerR HTH family regulatory protein [Streptomyces sp. 2314.4]SEE37448.1 MerR HTH family regulatory protein [Streptomyces sp. 2112.2]
MTEQPPPAEYRIEDLAHLSGATVRTIRAYQDRGLLPRPERRGRANVYGEPHLTRLRQIAGLLDRGYTLASIKELLQAWDAGLDLGGVLGLVAEIDGPWTDEEPSRLSRAELDAAFGGTSDETAIAEAVALGVLERVPGRDDEFLVPSPQELAVAAELHSAGVPLRAISGHLREVRGQVEHIAARFLDFTTEHVFQPFLDHPPTEAEAAEAAALVRRLRPLAQQTIDAELARAMRTLATRYLRHHLSDARPAETRRPTEVVAAVEPVSDPRPETGPAAVCEEVLLPADAVRAVRALVGPENAAAFIAAAAHREVQARTMDALAAGGSGSAPACGSRPAPSGETGPASAGGSRPAPAGAAAGTAGGRRADGLSAKEDDQGHPDRRP